MPFLKAPKQVYRPMAGQFEFAVLQQSDALLVDSEGRVVVMQFSLRGEVQA